MTNMNTQEEKMQNREKFDDFKSTVREGGKEVKNAFSEVEGEVKNKINEGKEGMKDIAAKVEDRLHKDPWPVVAGVAIGCLLFGFIMGSSKR